jgi:hypothetical protein
MLWFQQTHADVNEGCRSIRTNSHLMNKIPTRCSKCSLFSSFFSLHVSGATFTHHQEPQLCMRIWCHCINRLCGWAKCVPDPDQLYWRCESEMSPATHTHTHTHTHIHTHTHTHTHTK